jgi:hypothetical protein
MITGSRACPIHPGGLILCRRLFASKQSPTKRNASQEAKVNFLRFPIIRATVADTLPTVAPRAARHASAPAFCALVLAAVAAFTTRRARSLVCQSPAVHRFAARALVVAGSTICLPLAREIVFPGRSSWRPTTLSSMPISFRRNSYETTHRIIPDAARSPAIIGAI